MRTAHKTIAVVYSVLSVAGAFLVSKTGCLAFAADLALTFFLLKRKSLISFSLSLVPALMAFLGFAGCPRWWVAVSVAVTISLTLIYKGRLPETRQTTDLWVGTLILTVLTCVAPFIVLCV